MRIYTQENFCFLLCGCYMYNYWTDRTDKGLCEPLWSVRLNCQLMTMLEMIHMLQAQVCCCISAHPRLSHPKTKRETSNVPESQINQASWNRTVLNFWHRKSVTGKHPHLSFYPFFVIFPWSHELEKVKSSSVWTLIGCAPLT